MNENEIVSVESLDISKHSNGMTKREVFAMAAMQGLLSSDNGCTIMHGEIIDRSLKIADGILKELDK